MRWLALVTLLAGCAELGVISDGTSISLGRPSRGYLLDGVRLPDRGEGFVTRDVWRERDNRFGTDEMVDLITGVARRMNRQVRDVKLVVADLSGRGGGERLAFHRSHQTGRDVDILYYMRDASGQPFEPDAMRRFNARARAADGSGITIDIPRTWALVKELITAHEAVVQWVFMYEPIAQRLLEHAEKIGEPPALIARARKACRQPGDSARHDDHMHVRVYCSATDRAYGCVDIGPMELLAEREAEPSPMSDLLAALMPNTSPAVATSSAAMTTATTVGATTAVTATTIRATTVGAMTVGAMTAVAATTMGATTVGATTVGTTTAESTTAESTTAGATPVEATTAGATPVEATTAGAMTPVGATMAGATMAGATTAGATTAGATTAGATTAGATTAGATTAGATTAGVTTAGVTTVGSTATARSPVGAPQTPGATFGGSTASGPPGPMAGAVGGSAAGTDSIPAPQLFGRLLRSRAERMVLRGRR